MNNFTRLKLGISLTIILFTGAKSNAQDNYSSPVIYQENSKINVSPTAFGKNGLAHILIKDTSYFIDSTGQKAFDRYINWYGDYAIVEKDKSKGLWNMNGYWHLAADYSDIKLVSKNYWRVSKDGKQTFAGLDGNHILPYYDQVAYLDGRYFKIQENNKWGVFDSESKKISIPIQYEQIDYCSKCENKPNYIYAKKDDQWGIVDFNNHILLPFTYKHHAYVSNHSDVWVESFSSPQSQLIIHIPSAKEFKVKDSHDYEFLGSGELSLSVRGKFGLINQQLDQVLEPIYDKISNPIENLLDVYKGPYALLEKDGKKGIYGAAEGIILPVKWDNIQVYGDYFVVQLKDKYGLYNNQGKELLAVDFSELRPIDESYQQSKNIKSSKVPGPPMSKKNVKHIDFKRTKDQVPPIFLTKKQDLTGLYFANNAINIEPQYKKINYDILRAHQDIRYHIYVESEHKKGWLNTLGEQIIPTDYTQSIAIGSPEEQYYKVAKDKKWGIYDPHNNKETIPTRFYALDTLAKNPTLLLSIIDENNKYLHGLYSLSGEEIIAPKYEIKVQLTDSLLLFSHPITQDKALIVNILTSEITQLPTPVAAPIANSHLLKLTEDYQQAMLYDPIHKKIISDNKFTFINNPYKNSALLELHSLSKEGVAWVKHNDLYGLMDKGNTWIQQPTYLSKIDYQENNIAVGILHEGRAQYSTNYNHYQFINSKGKPLVNQKFICPKGAVFPEDFFLSNHLLIGQLERKSGEIKKGLMDIKSNILLPAIYERIESYNQGEYFMLFNDNKIGIADHNGQILIPVEFDNFLLLGYLTNKEITFPILGLKDKYWNYYTKQGKMLQVQGITEKTWADDSVEVKGY